MKMPCYSNLDPFMPTGTVSVNPLSCYQNGFVLFFIVLCINLIKKLLIRCPFQEMSLCVNILSLWQSTSVWAQWRGWLVSHESWNIMMPASSLFNYLLSFCPIDLHCEAFNYTIHHLLNMKNGVKAR